MQLHVLLYMYIVHVYIVAGSCWNTHPGLPGSSLKVTEAWVQESEGILTLSGESTTVSCFICWEGRGGGREGREGKRERERERYMYNTLVGRPMSCKLIENTVNVRAN